LAQQSKWGSIIAGVTALLICVATLTPGTPPSAEEIAACRQWCGDSLVADFVRNIILFLPLGFGLRLAGVRASRAILVGACLSAVVELLQIRVIVGRDASVLDWISNSLGTATGVLIASHSRVLTHPRPQAAARLVAGALALWVGILVLGAWGIQPAPSSDPYWGQLAPQLGDFPPFRGELLSARVNGVEMPSARMVNDDTVRAPLRAGRIRVEAIVRPGPPSPPTGIAPIARIADGAEREIFMLGRGGRELVFRVRLRASTLLLETPAFALADAFRNGQPVDRATVEAPESLFATVDRGRVRLAARQEGEARSREFELTPAVAWSFFLPWDYWFGPNAAWIAQVWLGALLFPVGYWAALTAEQRGARRSLLLTMTFVVLTLVIVPELFSLPHVRISHVVSALAGVVLGWSAAARLTNEVLIQKS
jgi:VanZ family protein